MSSTTMICFEKKPNATPRITPLAFRFFLETSFKVERFLKPFYSNENQKQTTSFGHFFAI
jgi:hypothetical protein